MRAKNVKLISLTVPGITPNNWAMLRVLQGHTRRHIGDHMMAVIKPSYKG